VLDSGVHERLLRQYGGIGGKDNNRERSGAWAKERWLLERESMKALR